MPLFLFSAIVAFIAIVLLARHFVRRGLAPERIAETLAPVDIGLPCEEVRIATADGKRLFGWYLPATGGGAAPAVAILHGWGGNAEMMLPLAHPLRAAGFAILLFDARCHGRSDEDSFTSMPRFAEDLGHALDWLAAQPNVDPRRLSVVGHSVGAAATLLAASRRDGLAAVVALATFAHPRAMMQRWLDAKRIPWPAGRLILRYVEHVIGHRFDDIAPVTTVRRVHCPVLIVHGSEDTTVPVTEAHQIHAARSGDHVRLRIVAGSHDDFGDEADVAGEITEIIGFLRESSGLPR